MRMNIKTTAEGCHVTVNIRLQSQTLLSLTDNDEKGVELLSGITYRFEWFVFTATDDAHAHIQASVEPFNEGFLPLNINKTFPAGVQDGNVFLFTLR